MTYYAKLSQKQLPEGMTFKLNEKHHPVRLVIEGIALSGMQVEVSKLLERAIFTATEAKIQVSILRPSVRRSDWTRSTPSPSRSTAGAGLPPTRAGSSPPRRPTVSSITSSSSSLSTMARRSGTSTPASLKA